MLSYNVGDLAVAVGIGALDVMELTENQVCYWDLDNQRFESVRELKRWYDAVGHRTMRLEETYVSVLPQNDAAFHECLADKDIIPLGWDKVETSVE